MQRLRINAARLRMGRMFVIAMVALPLQGCFTPAVLSRGVGRVEFEPPKAVALAPDRSVSFITQGEVQADILDSEDNYRVRIPAAAIEDSIRSGQNPRALKWAELPGVEVSRASTDTFSVCPNDASTPDSFGPNEAIPFEMEEETVLVGFDHKSASMKFPDPKWYLLLPVAVAGDAAGGLVGMGAGALATGLMVASVPVIFPLMMLNGGNMRTH